MNAVMKLASAEWLNKKNTPVRSPQEQLREDIRALCDRMEQAYARFEFEQDKDLVEAAIYEIQSLKAQYRYLLRIAKEQGVTCSGPRIMELEKEEVL